MAKSVIFFDCGLNDKAGFEACDEWSNIGQICWIIEWYGKCNNLVNYRKNKSGLEVLLPDVESLFDLLGQNRTFIVFDPFIPGKD